MFHPEVFAEIKRLEKLIKEKGTDEAKKYSTWGNNKQSTTEVESQSTIEDMVCTECFFDRDATDKDTKKFNDEMSDIDRKLDKLIKTGENKQ